jgi:hypothetical protein
MSTRIHEVSPSQFHWAIEKAFCYKCGANKGFRCIDTEALNVCTMPSHKVHVVRVRANGFNAI